MPYKISDIIQYGRLAAILGSPRLGGIAQISRSVTVVLQTLHTNSIEQGQYICQFIFVFLSDPR